mgnify:CR=1 FL=1
MQPRMIMTPLAPYTLVIWNGVNESGILPVGDRVLVLPDEGSKSSAGGIDFTPDQIGRNSDASETGVLVAVAEGAWFWNSDRTRKFEGVRPEVGQRVWFERYAGSEQFGVDGVMYRLMLDKCVGAVAAE